MLNNGDPDPHIRIVQSDRLVSKICNGCLVAVFFVFLFLLEQENVFE